TAVTAGDNNVTRIERDAAGNVTALVAPLGQRTTLTLNTEGYLGRITNPAGEALQLDYDPDRGGLLTDLTRPGGGASHCQYDAQGRLTRDENPADGFTQLTRTEQARGYTVTVTTAEGRISTYQVEKLSDGSQRRVNTSAAGLQTVILFGADG